MNSRPHKQVVVIGAGVNGICTAYYLAKAGHDVAVIERHGNVAEEASFGSSGLVSPGCAFSPAAPDMPKKILWSVLKRESSVIYKPRADRALWRWIRRWVEECDIERYQINSERMQRIVRYSRELLLALEEEHGLEYEQTRGVLQLVRSAQDMDGLHAVANVLTDRNIAHRIVDAEAARAIEPGLTTDTAFEGGLYLPNDGAGNCPLFARQMRQVAQSLGVQFHFSHPVDAIAPNGHGVSLKVGGETIDVDAVVVAGGCDSMKLLAPLGIGVPLRAIKGYTATATIKNHDAAPQGAIMDDTYGVTLSRMGNRVRLSGVVEPSAVDMNVHQKAVRMLTKIGADWFPGAANYNSAIFWCGNWPVMPDGPPVIGATPIDNIYLNIGHGASGWAMAAGCGKIVADVVSRRVPDIEMTGLMMNRYV